MTVAAPRNRAFSQKFLGQVAEVAIEDPEFTAAALADAAGYINHLANAEAISVRLAEASHLQLGTRSVPYVSYPLFKITHASGHDMATALTLDELFEARTTSDDIDKRLNALIETIEDGGARPAYMSADYRLKRPGFSGGSFI